MMDDKNKNPEDETPDDEIESPVDGPTPDWMRLATSGGGSGSSLTDENTPAWLKSIRSGQGRSTDKPIEPPELPSPPQAEAASTAGDEMSDLERLLAEEGIDLSSVAEERPEDAGGMSARDWLIATSSEEIIRNKLGTHPFEEEPAELLPADAPLPTEAADDDVWDLERLLAEEGIDLSSVAEERPEEAGGMSARDWLISTSSEEIIRNKLGTQPPEEKPAAPPASDDKMVVEADLPDWLQEIAEESGQPEPDFAVEATPSSQSAMADEDDRLVVAEELPDWLQEFADETPAASTTPRKPAEATTEFDEDKMVAEEELPDWLREVADESSEADEAGLVLPDFDQAPVTPVVGRSTPASVDEDKMVVEADLPDWLREVSDMPLSAAEPVEPDSAEAPPDDRNIFTSADEDKMVVEADLPDWLQEIADEPEPALPRMDELPAFPAAEHLPPAPADEDKMVVTEDLPDWLQEIADEPLIMEEQEPAVTDEASPVSTAITTAVAEDTIIIAEEELPDWLREAGTESEAETLPPFPSATGADKMIVAEDLPDWLREVEAGSAESETITAGLDLDVASTDDEIESDEDLPGWLQEVEVSSLEDELFRSDAPAPREEPAEETSAPPFMSSEAELDFPDDDEDLPGWLKEVQERDGKEMADLISGPPLTAFQAADSGDETVVDEELPDWLTEIQDEPSTTVYEEIEPVGSMIVEEDLPDWLREDQLDADEPFEPSEPSPEPLAETIIEEELTIDNELPDWLQEARDETPEAVSPEVEMPTSVAMTEAAAGFSTDDMIDEEELPDWLREAAAEEEEAEPLISAEPAPEPITASSEASDSFIAAEAEEAEEVEVEPEEAEIEEEIELEEPAPADEAIEVEEVVPVSPVEPEPVSVSEPLETVAVSGGIPDWLQKLREVEEEGPPMVPVTPVPVSRAVKPAPKPVYAQTVVTSSPDIPADAEDRLKLARTARDKGDLNEAVRIYDSLVVNGAYLDRIIEDMQQTIKAYPGNYLLFQVMGDAMMRDGRLQSALKAYREALSKLS